ncbi:MAG: AAA family ATPase [Candidatus Glassbacteria bacterium]
MNATVFVESLQSSLKSFLEEPTAEKKRIILQQIGRCTHLPFHMALEDHLLDKCAEVSSVQRSLEKLKETIDTLTCPPCYQGILVDFQKNGSSDRAVVSLGNGGKIETAISPEVERSGLHIGDVVVLNNDSTCVLGSRGPYNRGEVAELDRILEDGRLVLTEHGSGPVIVNPAEPLRGVLVKAGSRIRFDRHAALAFEVIEEREFDGFFDRMAEVSFDDVGGLDEQIERIRQALFWPLMYPEKYARYPIEVPKGILLSGPPGCGKTLLAQATICELLKFYSERNPGGEVDPRSHFLYVKGPEILSMWVGESERAIRDIFRKAGDISRSTGLAVIIFWDEIESIVPVRGSRISSSIDGTVVPAFLSEMDGLEERNGKVILIAATNRPDVIDPAVLRRGRMDVTIEIPRPNRQSARRILNIYLTPDLPYQMEDGEDRAAKAAELVEAAVSYIYRQSEGESSLATVMLRDGSRRTVRPSQLFSGAVAKNVVQRSALCALRQELEIETLLKLSPRSGRASMRKGFSRPQRNSTGISADILLKAIDEEFTEMVKILTPHNVKNYIDLPHEADVVAVEPASPAISAHGYVRH